MIMRWQTVALVILLLLLLPTLSTARGVLVDVNEEPIATQRYIQSPTNTTYSSRLLFLNISYMAYPQLQFDYSMTYSLDGKENQTIPLQIHNYEYHGYSMPYLKFINAEIRLPELSESTHYLTVFLKSDPPNSEAYYDIDTVYFTIDDGRRPNILDLTIENVTYNQRILTLNFTADEPTSWTAYSLDNYANMTVTQNMTISNLTYGSHVLTVYANDTVGNMGAQTVNFSVENLQTGIFGCTNVIVVIAVTVVIICVFAGILLLYRRHRKTANLN